MPSNNIRIVKNQRKYKTQNNFAEYYDRIFEKSTNDTIRNSNSFNLPLHCKFAS